MAELRSQLPVDAYLGRVLESLRAHPNLVLQAEPGAGKTTRLPPALLPLLNGEHRQVVVLEPRRLAARMAAQRVAEENGHTLGGVTGYQVRFEEVTSKDTRIRFVTEGILVRQLLQDRALRGVGAVVLDEFHERHIHGDVALAMLRRLQQESRPDLRIVVMSATLEAAPAAAFLGNCPVMNVPGRVFPVDVSFALAAEPTVGGRHLDKQVADAFRGLLNDGLDGDVLVFLPGMAEMRRAQEACAGLCARNDIMSVLLHAELPPDEQNRAVRPQNKRKLILSTNVAESSVTIDGVVAVVDSGLARIPSHAAWSGLTVLKVAKVSRASATQRAGRAGRTRAGRCVRLYTRHDHDSRPEHTPPEIRRLDLAETALMLHGVDVTNLSSFPFYEAPEVSSLKAAEDLLVMLQAVDADGRLTATGRQMLRLPLHPRQARVLLEAAQRGLPREGALVAAILGEGDMVSSTDGGRAAQKRAHHGCDVMAALDAVETAQAGGSLAKQAGALGLDVGALSRVDRTQKQLSSIVRNLGIPSTAAPKDEHTVLQQALLTGYADRVASRRPGQQGDNAEYLLAMGGTARVLPSSAASGSPLLVALDVEERVGGRNDGVKIRQASAVELDWLLDVVPHLLTDSVEVEWNAQAERVEAWSRLKLLQLSLEEKRLDKPDHPRVAELLAQQALKAGVGIFAELEALQKFRARVQLMRQHVPEADFPDVTEESFKDALRAVCDGRRSFKELKDADVLEQLHALLTYEQRQQLGNEVPGEIRLPGGRRTQVHYVMGQPPWVESRLQDFFGQLQTPRILRGRVPLNVHLLAPNHRAVQITNDLSGFWERHYQGIRRELMRKYPRHSWPEDPTTAEPPQPKPRPH